MRLSPSGTKIAYVAHQGDPSWLPTITVVEAGVPQALAPGHDPRWLTDDTLLWRDHQTGEVRRARAPWDTATMTGVYGNTLTAANGRWAAGLSGPRTITRSWSMSTPLYGLAPELSDDGAWLAYLVPDDPRPGVSTVIIQAVDTGTARVAHVGAPEQLRWGATTLCWRDAGRIFGRSTPDMATVALSIPGRTGAFPKPVWDGERLWVAMVVDEGDLVLAEWGSLVAQQPMGYVSGASAGSGFDWDWRVAA